MDEMTKKNLLNKLVSNLEDLTKSYRQLLELLRKEKEFLTVSDLTNLGESNKNKELLLLRIKAQDTARERYARELAHAVGTDSQQPRLLEIAKVLQGDDADRLRVLHATLDLLIRRVYELNKDNELLTKNALAVLGGAMGEIKDTLAPKKTYERQGKMTKGSEQAAGNFVSREA